jgi:hypothetical protein
MRPAQRQTGAPGPSPQGHPDGPNTVNESLTSNRARRVVENDQYAAFARRILRAYARRVAAGDIEAIAYMAALADETDRAIRCAITGLRGYGYSWAEIGARLGVTRQAAQQRWGTPSAPGGDAT